MTRTITHWLMHIPILPFIHNVIHIYIVHCLRLALTYIILSLLTIGVGRANSDESGRSLHPHLLYGTLYLLLGLGFFNTSPFWSM